jgi:hypothetical protein
MQVVSNEIFDVATHIASEPLAGEENIIGPVSARICLRKHLPARPIPVIDAGGFLDTAPIGVIHVGDAPSSNDAVFRVK